MLDQIVIIASLIFFLVVGLAFKTRKFDSIGEFTITRNKLKWFSIAAGISMTFAGGAALLNMASLGYTFGWYTLVDPLALIGGILIVLIFIKTYQQDSGVTISNLLSKSDRKLSVLIGIITSVVFILILAAQFVALSKLLSPYFTSIHPLILTTVLSAAIFSYVFWGGFSSVTKTDILQLVFIGLFLVAPVIYFILVNKPALPEHSDRIIEFTKMPLNLIILLSLSLLFIPLSQDVNIRVKSAVSKKQAITGLLVGAGLYATIVVISSFLGITIANSGMTLDDPELAFTTFFQTYYPSFGIMAVLAALAAIISTMDSYSLNAITSVSQDLFSETKALKNKNHKQLIKIAGLTVFVAALSIALFFNEILALILTALLIYISVLIPIAIGKRLGVKDNLILWSSFTLITGIVLMEVLKFKIDPKAVYYPISGIVLIIMAYLLTRFNTTEQ